VSASLCLSGATNLLDELTTRGERDPTMNAV